jgi:glycosyltransferase involved in cell wall biosynthesis
MGLWQISKWFKSKPIVYHPEIKFSIIIPTRNRHTLLVRCLDSILKQTNNISCVEILLMSDSDDIKTHKLVEEYIWYNPTLNIVLDKQDRNIYNNENYINKAARKSRGRYLWTIGNDCEIISKDWDIHMERKIEGYLQDKPDRICYVMIDDDFPHPQPRPCCFPIITKETFLCLGVFMPKEIPSYGADHWLWQCFRKIPRITRILDISDAIKVLHYCQHNGRTKQDELYNEMYNTKKKDFLTEGEEKAYIDKLTNGINNYD